MSKKRIYINESQLCRFIKQSINEISIQTKMSAANKAAREASKLSVQSSDPYVDDPDPELTRKKWNKKIKQKRAFRDAVNQEMDELPFTANTNFRTPVETWEEPTDSRGDMGTDTKPIYFGRYGKYVFDSPNDERDKKFNDVEQFLNGNSYYERGRGWVNPDDEGYDMQRSEPWARIRRKNEAIAHKVTENIIREIKRNSYPIKKV